LREVESQTHAAPWFFGGEKRLSNALQNVAGHTIASIDYQYMPGIVMCIAVNLDIGAWLARIERVLN
jgi:hypothetical protein